MNMLRYAVLVSAQLVCTSVWAACITPAPASSDSIARFGSEPNSVLASHPVGGAAMVTQVRDLATSDIALVRPLLGLAPSASSEQAAALGTGLAQAAAACLRTDPGAAQGILAAIIQTNDARVETAYRAIAGDIQTAAIGGAGAGGGGGLGGSGTQIGGSGGEGGGRTGVGTTSAIFPNTTAGIAVGGGSTVTLGNTSRLSGQISPN